jgi:peptide/nickel transport system substrate-binding protein
MYKKPFMLLVLALAAMLLMAACQPTTVEVTREVVVEVTTAPEEVEVTRVVEVETEVTREVVETVTEVVTTRGQGGTLNILYWQAASTMNPYLSGGTKDIHAASIVLEPLARYDENGNMVAWLAAEIPTVENGGVSEDLTSITWKLKEGLLWSDGTPVTAADVVFTGEYCMNEEMGCNAAPAFNDVASIEAVDDLTVKITFSIAKPFPYGPFVGATVPILQQAQFAECTGAKAQECSDQNFNPIGTGAYMVKEFRANDVIVFAINENYRDASKPYFSEVVFKGGGDATSAARAVLETGEADYAWNLQVEPEVLSAMQLAGNGKLLTAFGTQVERIIVNFTNPSPDLGDARSLWTEADPNPHPFLSDLAVRQALSMAIDRNIITQIGYGPAGKPTCNLLPAPSIYVSTNNDSCLVQNIEEANRLLDEAGWVDSDGDGIRDKDGVKLSVLYQTSTNSVRQGTQALIKQMWEQIGVEAELKNVDAAVFFGGDPASPDTYGKFYADIQMYTNNFEGTDPEAYMGGWACSTIPTADNQWVGNNISRWCNEEYDALLAELATTADLAKRAEISIMLNDMLVQNYVEMPLVHRGSLSAHANSLLGVRMNPWDSELWNLADWSRSSQ